MEAALAFRAMIGSGLLPIALFLIASGRGALCDEWPVGTFQYEIRRGAEQIGVHTIAVKRDGESFVVEVTEWIDVAGWYGRYCHRAKRQEVWRDNELRLYDSAITGSCSGLVWGQDQVRNRKSCLWGDEREPIRFAARHKEGGLVTAMINFATGTRLSEARSTTLSTNFLNPLMRQKQEAWLFDPITGEQRAVKVTEGRTESLSLHGQTVTTQKYQYEHLDDSDEAHHVLYDREGVVIMMKNVRDDVTFILAPDGSSLRQSSPALSNDGCSPDMPLIVDMQSVLP